MHVEQLIEQFQLKPHPEGGYFCRTYAAPNASVTTDAGVRPSMTSIYYLLTSDSPIGHFHRNEADILHYFHDGDAITYYLIDPVSRELSEVVLGNRFDLGEVPQLIVPGGIWKASRLKPQPTKGYGLISEAVSPGFDYADMTLGAAVDLLNAFPEHRDLIPTLSQP